MTSTATERKRDFYPWRHGPVWAAVASGGNLAFGTILIFSHENVGVLLAGIFMLATALTVHLCTRDKHIATSAGERSSLNRGN
ncbi:MAG: hypothetical protein ABI400_10975 [Lacisediminihabitans sp.]